jgi:hypothetical protein
LAIFFGQIGPQFFFGGGLPVWLKICQKHKSIILIIAKYFLGDFGRFGTILSIFWLFSGQMGPFLVPG